MPDSRTSERSLNILHGPESSTHDIVTNFTPYI